MTMRVHGVLVYGRSFGWHSSKKRSMRQKGIKLSRGRSPCMRRELPIDIVRRWGSRILDVRHPCPCATRLCACVFVCRSRTPSGVVSIHSHAAAHPRSPRPIRSCSALAFYAIVTGGLGKVWIGNYTCDQLGNCPTGRSRAGPNVIYQLQVAVMEVAQAGFNTVWPKHLKGSEVSGGRKSGTANSGLRGRVFFLAHDQSRMKACLNRSYCIWGEGVFGQRQPESRRLVVDSHRNQVGGRRDVG